MNQEEFHNGSLEAGFMCCRRELDLRKPKSWVAMHLECPVCFGPKTLCSFLIGNPPPIKVWLCVPCHNAQPPLVDIIEANSIKKWLENACNIPVYWAPAEFSKKDDT